MSRLYLELYRGGIPESLAGLPGADGYDPSNAHHYWTVLTTPLSASAPDADVLEPEGPTPNASAVSHGTDTLPAGTTAASVVAAAIWSPKYPPYRFALSAPDGTQISLEPTTAGDTTWRTVPIASMADGMGIWVIEVEAMAAELPVAIDGRRAHLNPEHTTFPADKFYQQPLLALDVVPRGGSCPKLRELDIEGCAPGSVSVLAHVDGNLGDVVAISCDYGDDTNTTELSGAELTTNPVRFGPHTYAAGSHTAIVTIVRKSGCSPLVDTDGIDISACPASCPTLRPLEVSGCAKGRVTIGVHIDGELGSASELTIDWGDGSSATVVERADLQASQNFSHDYDSALSGSIVATLTRVDGCEPTPYTKDARIPLCETDVCPELGGIDVQGCAGEGAVTLTANVSNAGLVERFTWDFGDGPPVQGGQAVSHTYTDRRDYTAKVTIERPARCSPRTSTVSVPVSACRPPTNHDDDDDHEASWPIPSCAVLLFLALLFLVAGAALLGVGICVASWLYLWATGYWWIIGLVIAGIGLALMVVGHGLLLLWLLLCGSCPENCPLLQLAFDVLLFLAGLSAVLAFLAFILAALDMSPFCWVGWVIDFLDFTVLAIIVLWYARLVGCMEWPRWLPWGPPDVPDVFRVACDLMAGRWSNGPRAAPAGVRPPSGLLTAMNAGGAAARMGAAVVRGKPVVAAADLAERRVATCIECPYFRAGRCARCGCFVALKAKLVTERCPLGRWPSA